jgi:hypothetical protein
MKTLQRTLDCLLAIQGHQHIEQYSTSSMSGPDSPARLDEGDAHPVPFIQMDSKQISAPKSTENRQLSQLDLTASLSRAQGPEEAGDMTASSIDTVQSHRDFCERALDVSCLSPWTNNADVSPGPPAYFIRD